MLLVSGAHAWPQGQLVFDNRVNNVVVARIYGIDPANPALHQRGNDAAGFPVGTQNYSGAPLDGDGFTTQLFGGPPHAAARNLQPMQPAVSFRAEAGAGFVLAPPSTVTVSGVPGGQAAKVQLRAWNNRGGTITNWAQVEFDPAIPHGESWPFITPPLGGPFHAPPNLTGLESFNLATGAVEGFSIKINFQTSGAPPPPGYLADTGQPFAGRGNGFEYGWNFDHAAFARDRDATNSLDQRHDTFIEMQTNSVWEIALSNGLYGVHVVVGNPIRTNGLYRVEAEGIVIAEGTPTIRQRWIERDVLIEIGDSTLTLRSGAGAVSNALCFVEIARISPVRVDVPPPGSLGDGVPLRFVGEAGIEQQIQYSTNLSTWLPLGIAQLVRGDRFLFTDGGVTNSPGRFYRARTLSVP